MRSCTTSPVARARNSSTSFVNSCVSSPASSIAHDVHLVAAAVTRGADVICSSNRRHMPEGQLAGGIEIVGPGRLAAGLGIG